MRTHAAPPSSTPVTAKLAAVAWLALCCAGTRPAQAAKDPKAILDYVDDLYRGASAHGKMTMKVTTEHWTRELKLEFWSKGTDKSLVRILAPLKEKGTATLRVSENIWNYLPKTNRIIKVPSSMMGGSWMGSHFTNDDLVKESRMSTDFTFVTSFEGERDGKKIVELTLTPKPDAAVVWGKVVVEVEQDSYLPVRTRYYDEDLRETRVMTFGNVKRLAGRTLPTLMKVIPNDKPNEATEVSYDEIAYDVALADDVFGQQNLQR